MLLMTSLRTIALTFQNLIIQGKVKEAFEKYIHPQFKHHNPYFKGDRESLMRAMEENAAQFPHKIFEVQRVIEQNDLVVVHSKLRLKEPMPPIATVHIFRFDRDKIIEEWDIAQQVPEDCQNENDMF